MNDQKKKKSQFRFLCLAFVLIIIGIGVFLHLWSKSEFGSRFIFESDYRQMKKVADYLISLEYDDVYISGFPGTMIVGPRETERIKDLGINWTIFLLFAKGYDRIEKNDGKTICFERWYDLFERYRGYAFSIDGSEELSIEFVIEQKAMPETDWYYYIEDYNKWRTMQD